MSDVKWIKICTCIFDDEKIKYLESLPDGDSIVLMWIKILTVSGKTNLNGKLMLTESTPYSEESLSTIIGMPFDLVCKAIKIFKNLEMITEEDGALKVTNWDKHQNIDGLERIKEKRRISNAKYYQKRKESSKESDKNLSKRLSDGTDIDIDKDIEKEYILNTSCTEPEKTVSMPKPKEVKEFADVAPIVLNSGEDYIPEKSFVDNLIQLYPAVDVKNEFRKMAAWCISNPQKRKTKRGINSFINGWLSREQDRPTRKTNTMPVPEYMTASHTTDLATDDEVKAIEEMMKRAK